MFPRLALLALLGFVVSSQGQPIIGRIVGGVVRGAGALVGAVGDAAEGVGEAVGEVVHGIIGGRDYDDYDYYVSSNRQDVAQASSNLRQAAAQRQQGSGITVSQSQNTNTGRKGSRRG